MDTTVGSYRHTQAGPWHLLLYVLGCFSSRQAGFSPLLAFADHIPGDADCSCSCWAASFHHLTVTGEGEPTRHSLRPIAPVSANGSSYDEITAVEKGRTTILDGWGIHLSLRGGMGLEHLGA